MTDAYLIRLAVSALQTNSTSSTCLRQTSVSAWLSKNGTVFISSSVIFWKCTFVWTKKSSATKWWNRSTSSWKLNTSRRWTKTPKTNRRHFQRRKSLNAGLKRFFYAQGLRSNSSRWMARPSTSWRRIRSRWILFGRSFTPPSWWSSGTNTWSISKCCRTTWSRR